MIKKLGALALIVLVLAVTGQAWNGKGHQTVAYIAYVNLDPAVRKKIDKLLESHPDFERLTEFAGSPTSENYHLIIFMNAATWPDSIRKDPRFYDETDPDAIPTKRFPGFPSMKKFTRWHFIDLPFSTDGSELTQPASINALKLLVAARRAINNSHVSANNQAYFLSWLLHVAGDVHQPLHCTSRFTQELSPPINPDGDRGGNGFDIPKFQVLEGDFEIDNLHSYWDNVLGVRRDLPAIKELATKSMTDNPKPTIISTDERLWINQSFKLARTRVYKINPTTELEPNTALPDNYLPRAQKLARARVAIAGYRLAEVLNRRFKQ